MLHTPSYAASVREFRDFSTPFLPGRLHVPIAEADPNNPRPLILFLHGLGETGSNNVSQIGNNINNLLTGAKINNAYLYAPQATTATWSSSHRTSLVMTMIDRAIAEHNVDEERIYVTGLSMGGGGTWNMLNRFSDRFAAGVPIAGISPASDFLPDNLVETPIWAFHARNDNVVNKSSSRSTVNNILRAAGEPFPQYPPSNNNSTTLEFSSSALDLRYTEWPTGGHGIWSRVYNTNAMYDWLFSQSIETGVPEPSSSVLLVSLTVFATFFRQGRGNRSGITCCP